MSSSKTPFMSRSIFRKKPAQAVNGYDFASNFVVSPAVKAVAAVLDCFCDGAGMFQEWCYCHKNACNCDSVTLFL